MENAKTFRKERTYLIYGIILFFILINLFFLPKSTHNAELVTSAHSTTPIIPIQPDKPTTNNNIPEGTETKPITTIPEEKKDDKPPVVEKPKEETKEEEKKSENGSNKDNTQKTDNKPQEKTTEKPNEETKVVPPPTEVKEEPKAQNDNTNNNKAVEKEPEKVIPAPPKKEETKPEDNRETKGREQMNFQQTTSRRFLRGFENFCMFGFIGVIVYLIYNNGENNNDQQNQDNQRDNKKKDNTNPSGYALLDDDAEYYENI